jgi:hypothetical protein
MVGRIVKVWPHARSTTVLVRDAEDGVTKSCWINMREEIGPWMASLCQSAKGPVVLRLSEKTDRGFEITDAEMLHSTQGTL